MDTKTEKTQEKELRPSLVPPFLAALISVFIPGLGQVLARAYRRGFVLLGSFISISGLTYWRIAVEGRRGVDLQEKIQKAFEFESVLIVIVALVGLLYLWIIVDAYLIAKQTDTNPLVFLPCDEEL